MDNTDAGGLHVTSADYTMDGSIGGIGGVISSAGNDTAKHGYIGQLTEVGSLILAGAPAQVNEGATSQCGGTATLDDGTFVVLAGSEIRWGAYAWPLDDLGVEGLATAANVYQNTSAVLGGDYLGVVGGGSLLVLDSNPDDFGLYAADDLPDVWQVQYFGLDNTNAFPDADADGTGQNNLYKYIAGLNPTNPASIFAITAFTTAPSTRQIHFSSVQGRVYSLKYTTNIVNGTWSTVAGQADIPGVAGFARLSTLVALMAAFTLPSAVFGQVPGIVNYQGRVAVSGTNFTGTGQFQFALVDAAGATTYWSNGVAAVSLPVSKGLYGVLLGDTTLPNMAQSIAPSVFTNGDVRLRVWFNDGVAGLQQLVPDQRLAAAGYALNAARAQAFTGAVADSQLSTNVARLYDTPNTSRQATGTLVIEDGVIVGVNMTDGGSGYDPWWPLVVTVDDFVEGGGGGFGAEFFGEVNEYGEVSYISVMLPGGENYTANATLVIEPPPENHVQTFTCDNNFTGVTSIRNNDNQFYGTFGGNGFGLYGLNASYLSTGTLPDARLSTNVLLRSSGIWSVLGSNTYYNAGNVGIGTATPSLYGHGGTGRILEINNTNTAMHSQSHLILSTGVNSLKDSAIGSVTWAQPGGMAAYIGAQTRSTTPNSPSAMLTFGTRQAGDPGASPRMVITEAGNVGIGTTTPGGKLHVVGNWDGEQGALQLSGDRPSLRFTGGFSANLQSWLLHVGSHGPGNLEFMSRTGANAWESVLALSPYDGNVSVKSLTIRGGADVAEPFQMSAAEIPKGSVVVIDDENAGQLKLSERAYDTRVAGIVSGANGINPGIALHQDGILEGGQNVALSGRVYVQADATYGAIKSGDMLTTSDTPGHAMRVSDHSRAQGAILGKAMSTLQEGKGMVLVLVTLQ